MTPHTRVSFDFRLIPGRMFSSLVEDNGGSSQQPGGKVNFYRQKEGYYCCCHRSNSISTSSGETVWHCKKKDLHPPDARMGFPWTVTDWDIFWKKK